MKQVLNLHPDNINSSDGRFNFKETKKEIFSKSPNSLPLFWKFDDLYIPCTHFSPIKKKNNFSALVYNDDISYEDALKDLILHCDLTVFDIAGILKLLESYSPDHNKFEWSAFLGIPAKEWDKIKALSAIPLSWKEYFISKNTPLKRILSFSDPLLLKAISELLGLNPGINILEQIALLLKEISLRDKLSYQTILEKNDIRDLLQGADTGNAQKLQILRSKLFSQRYPTMTEYRTLLQTKKTELEKLQKMQIGIDENFETPGIELKYTMTDTKDIDNLEQWLESNRKILLEILDFQNGKKGN
ncbi:MAG: hypothetical protein WCT23_02250 [Candidatus Neomarinimicrobiota bacterium]